MSTRTRARALTAGAIFAVAFAAAAVAGAAYAQATAATEPGVPSWAWSGLLGGVSLLVSILAGILVRAAFRALDQVRGDLQKMSDRIDGWHRHLRHAENEDNVLRVSLVRLEGRHDALEGRVSKLEDRPLSRVTGK